MKQSKRETFIYEGLGFPVHMVNVPMKKVMSEWVMNINFAELQRFAMLMLAKKPTSLTGKEVRAIRHYLNMSTHKFAEELGVSHVSILHWENEDRKMKPSAEITMRLYVLNRLKVTDKEFRKTYTQFDVKLLSNKSTICSPLEIDAEKIAC
jgi:DNA-binding transcriptional regulator YiaG